VSTELEPSPEVTRSSLLSMQVCVPVRFTDLEAEEYANAANPTGSPTLVWRMRHQGDEALAGCDERVKCGKRAGCVHIMLDC
jgi:hypothetical protein